MKKCLLIFVCKILISGYIISQTYNISGKAGMGVVNMSMIPSDFVIVLKNTITNDSTVLPMTTTDYIFKDVPKGGNYKLYVKKSKDPNDYYNGVSTIDIIMIQRHILGIDPFENVYKSIAADANEDGKVTASDIVLLRQLILGYMNKLQNSWKIGVKNDINKQYLEYTNLSEDKTNQDFVLIKIGDINGNAR
jgi:hypothetical protein